MLGVRLWDRMEGEPNSWYDRFTIYRLLGSRRSIQAAHTQYARQEGYSSERPPTSWYRQAEKWRWKERAEAWDEAERKAFEVSEQIRRYEARRRRLGMIEAAQEGAYKALELAKLDDLSVDQARELLGVIRLLLMDALKAERLEYGESTEIVDNNVELTADDLVAATQELEAWRIQRAPERNG